MLRLCKWHKKKKEKKNKRKIVNVDSFVTKGTALNV